MSRKLALIAFGGIAVGAVCMGVAMAVGGQSVLSHLDDFDFDWDSPRCGVALANTDGVRELDWTGGERVTFDIPANVHYVRGEGDKLVIRGDNALLPLVELDDGRIKMSCHMRRMNRRLDITLPGTRDFQRYTIDGSADMKLEGIDQPRLRIRINGSGDVTASGKAGELEYSVAGSGDGHFEGLDAGNVTIGVAGSGDADVAPRERLEVNIAGSGKVTLHAEPRTLETHIAGSGRIIHVDGTVTKGNGLTTSHRERDSEVPEPPAPPEPPPAPGKGI